MGAARQRLAQEDRHAVSDYNAAVWRIVQRRCEGISTEAADELYKIVADIYWVTDKQVRRDVFIAQRSIGG